MPYKFIKVSDHKGVMRIELSDPSTRNAIGDEMSMELSQELERLNADADLRVLLLTGTDPAFCSGANVKQMRHGEHKIVNETNVPYDVSPWEYLDREWAREDPDSDYMDGVRFMPLKLHRLQKPSIAAVNGYAMGLGMGIALSCDIRIASDKALFSETFVKRGLIPADGSCWQLPRMIGLSNTYLLQYTGDTIHAEDAYRMGLVSKVVSHESLMEEAIILAERIASGATYSMSLIKKLLQESLFVRFDKSLELAGTAQNIARKTEDHKEGVSAFIEKRPPSYKGR